MSCCSSHVYRRSRDLAAPAAAPPRRAAARPAGTPRRRPPRCRAPARRPPRTGVPKCRRSSSTYSPMNMTACSTVARKTRRTAAAAAPTMNCVPMMPARNPTTVFASPPMPMTPLDSASCTSPANVPASRPVDRPRRQRHVDHHDQHQVDRDRPAHDEPRQRGLKRERQRRPPGSPRRLSLRAPLGRCRVPASASATTSTSSSP